MGNRRRQCSQGVGKERGQRPPCQRARRTCKQPLQRGAKGVTIAGWPPPGDQVSPASVQEASRRSFLAAGRCLGCFAALAASLACCLGCFAGLLACWLAGFLACWLAGLLACWLAGLLSQPSWPPQAWLRLSLQAPWPCRSLPQRRGPYLLLRAWPFVDRHLGSQVGRKPLGQAAGQVRQPGK